RVARSRPAPSPVPTRLDVALPRPWVAHPVAPQGAGPRAPGGPVQGAVIHVDRFGNLVTSLSADAIAEPAVVRVAGRVIPVVGTYGDLARGGLGALVGSSGRLEIAGREGSAAAVLRARRGERVTGSPRWASRT